MPGSLLTVIAASFALLSVVIVLVIVLVGRQSGAEMSVSPVLRNQLAQQFGILLPEEALVLGVRNFNEPALSYGVGTTIVFCKALHFDDSFPQFFKPLEPDVNGAARHLVDDARQIAGYRIKDLNEAYMSRGGQEFMTFLIHDPRGWIVVIHSRKAKGE